MSGPNEKWFQHRQADIDAIIEAEKERNEPDEDFIRYQENLRSNYDVDEEKTADEEEDYYDDEEEEEVGLPHFSGHIVKGYSPPQRRAG